MTAPDPSTEVARLRARCERLERDNADLGGNLRDLVAFDGRRDERIADLRAAIRDVLDELEAEGLDSIRLREVLAADEAMAREGAAE